MWPVQKSLEKAAAPAESVGLLRRLARIWFLEILEYHHGGECQPDEEHKAPRVAPRCVAAGPLRVEVRIAKFGQRVIPVFEEWRAVPVSLKGGLQSSGWLGTPLFLW